MPEATLLVKKYKTEGHVSHEYNPLRNIIKSSIEAEDSTSIDWFRTKNISVDLQHPVDIQCQESYDGTVNLILNDDLNPPRIVNSRFSVLENDRYKIINRNQSDQTNLYKEDTVDNQTRLFRNIETTPRFELISLSEYGQLKAGTYIFYAKFADNDYNQTDIVAESGPVVVYKGSVNSIHTISGGLIDEVTNKVINININDIDTSFTKVYIYFTRYTSDLNGFRIPKSYRIDKPYDITQSYLSLSINGYENVTEIAEDELNVKYNIVTAVKSQAQVQNMLFFANIQSTILNNRDLQTISHYISVSPHQKDTSIGYVDKEYSNTKSFDTEYYDPLTNYYYLGYWPEETYRLGIVYIMKDDSLSPVYNLRGCEFDVLGESNIPSATPGIEGNDIDEEYSSLYMFSETGEKNLNHLPISTDFITNSKINYSNAKGVFVTPSHRNESGTRESFFIQEQNKITDKWETKPLYFKISLSSDIKHELQKLNVKSFFIVRQKRIPNTIAQGVGIGVDGTSYIPMLQDVVNPNNYFAESFVGASISTSIFSTPKPGYLSNSFDSNKLTTSVIGGSGLLCLDANVNPLLQSNFNGTEYYLEKVWDGKTEKYESTSRGYNIIGSPTSGSPIMKTSLTYIPSDVPLKYINNTGFSTRAGSAEDVKQVGLFREKKVDDKLQPLVRGVYTGFIGLGNKIDPSAIYNIKINSGDSAKSELMGLRMNDNSSYYSISDRIALDVSDNISIDCYRGDCYTNTVTIRMNRNFVDSEVPVNETIIDPLCWSDNFNGLSRTTDEQWEAINRADVNTVQLGHWITYKCLSNYNLGLRSEDTSNVEEMALMGNSRSFFPLVPMSVGTPYKVGESGVLNDGYSTALSQKMNILVSDVPYIKEIFDSRIMFSNVQTDDTFRNSYRIFQGLSYKDIDRQYGGITKIIPWNVHLLCIFEHGIGIVPVNEKALVSTNTGQSIHMYGAGVLQNQITLINPDFGTIWQDSIYRTPVGVYGVDTYAKKIWRYSESKGFEVLSDLKIQSFLNENINLNESDKYPIISIKNVKTHYNNHKGDVMFTFYNNGITWNMCFNERIGKWTTRYSWTPGYSENINNIFYSLDNERASVLGNVFYNTLGVYTDGLWPKEIDGNTTSGLRVKKNIWEGVMDSRFPDFITPITVVGNAFYDKFTYEIKKVKSSYIDSDGNEIDVEFTDDSRFYITENSGEHYLNIINDDLVDYMEYSKVVLKLCYLSIDIDVNCIVTVDGEEIIGTILNETVSILVTPDAYDVSNKLRYDQIMRNGFFVHGRAGVFNEIDYNQNQLKPTLWYNKQEPFEFEVVVNNLPGVHKIFNDLVIISNNVKPDTISYEIEGDVYDFNKYGLFNYPAPDVTDNRYIGEDLNQLENQFRGEQKSQKLLGRFADSEPAEVIYDPTLNKYSLKMSQECRDIKNAEFGRLKGNIHYKEGVWYSVIEPIYYKQTWLDVNKEVIGGHEVNVGSIQETDVKSTRIRDKFLKVKIRYTGDELVVITALKTMMTISYA